MAAATPSSRDIELIYEPSCPNIEAARELLRRALSEAGLPARWTEWDTTDPQSPERVLRYGSPTLLVGGEDVEASSAEGACCRLYPEEETGALRGVPSASSVIAALRRWG